MRAMKRTVSVLLSLMLVLGMMTIGMSAVGAAETHKVNVKSNIGEDTAVDFTASSEQVTVTYKLKADLDIVNTQGVITYDPAVLKIASTNTAKTVMPNFESNRTVNLTKKDGRIPFNCSDFEYGYDFKTEAVFATVVFDILDASADTDVNLNVSILTASTALNTTSENDVALVDGDVVDSSKFTSATEAKVTPEETVLPNIDAFVYMKGLNLKGKVGLQYLFKKNVTGYDTNKLAISIKGPHPEEDYDGAYNAMTNAGSFYQFAYNLKASYLSQPVTITISQDGTPVAQEVMVICDYIKDHPSSVEKTQILYNALLNYGARAQIANKIYTDNLANKYIDSTLAPLTSAQIAVADGVGGTHPSLSNMGMSVFTEGAELGSETAINIYYRIDNEALAGKTKISVNGTEVSLVDKGKVGTKPLKLLQIPNIAAKDMDGVYTITFTNGSNTATYKVCMLQYIKRRLAANNENDELCVSMYWYHIAAKNNFA